MRKTNRKNGETFSQGWEYNRQKIKWIFRRWRKHMIWLVVLFIMTLISVAGAFAYPFIFGRIVNLIRGENQGIEVIDNHAYVADGSEDLLIFDVSDSSNPVKIASLNLSGNTNDIALHDKYAFTVNGENGMQVIDVSDVRYPELVASVRILINESRFLLWKSSVYANVESIALNGDYAYLSCGKYGMRVVDISNPAEPEILNLNNLPESVDYIAVHEDIGFFLDGDTGLGIYDLSDPLKPECIGFLELENKSLMLDEFENHVYVATRDRFVHVIDLTDPSLPQPVSTIETSHMSSSVFVENGYAYIPDGDDGIKIANVDDPGNPEIVGELDTSGNAERIVFSQDKAYLLSGYSGLQIIDVKDKNYPVLLGSVTWRNVLLSVLILAFAAVGILRVLAAFYPSFRAMINLKIDMDVRNSAFAHILRKSQRYFLRFRTGDLVMRLTDDIYDYPKISWFCCSGIFRAVESTAKVIFCLAYMFTQNMLLTIIAFMPLPFMLAVFGHYQRALRDSYFDVRQAASETNNALESCFSGIRILKAYNGEENQAKVFDQVLEDRYNKEMKVVYLWTFIWHLYPAINMIGQVIVLGVGSWLIFQERFQVGTMYMFYVYMDMLLHPLLDIPNLFTTSRDAFACIDRQHELHEFDKKNDEFPDTEGIDIQEIDSIVFHDVGFAYEKLLQDEKEEVLSTAEKLSRTRQKAMAGEIEMQGEMIPVLNGINLTIKKGSKVAIVGSVGSGKTTLVKLITRILKPTEGYIAINGTHAEKFDIRKLRSLIGYTPQEVVLFSDSISDNVSFGREINEDDIRRVLNLAQVEDEVMAFEKGLDTILGQRGQTVSGGQKQRLAIARALAGKPSLLILDDCTAALDAENEERFWDDMRKYYPNTTCVIVTHRISTAKRADVIHVLENGTISHSGTHEELLKNCELYRDFQTREPVSRTS